MKSTKKWTNALLDPQCHLSYRFNLADPIEG